MTNVRGGDAWAWRLDLRGEGSPWILWPGWPIYCPRGEHVWTWIVPGALDGWAPCHWPSAFWLEICLRFLWLFAVWTDTCPLPFKNHEGSMPSSGPPGEQWTSQPLKLEKQERPLPLGDTSELGSWGWVWFFSLWYRTWERSFTVLVLRMKGISFPKWCQQNNFLKQAGKYLPQGPGLEINSVLRNFKFLELCFLKISWFYN